MCHGSAAARRCCSRGCRCSAATSTRPLSSAAFLCSQKMNHSPGLALLAVSHRQFDYARGYTGPSAAYFVDGAFVPPFLHALRALQPPNKSRALHFFRRCRSFVLFCCASSARSGTLQHRCTGHGGRTRRPGMHVHHRMHASHDASSRSRLLADRLSPLLALRACAE